MTISKEKNKEKDKKLPSLEKENLEVFGVLCHGDFSLDHLLFQVNKYFTCHNTLSWIKVEKKNFRFHNILSWIKVVKKKII